MLDDLINRNRWLVNYKSHQGTTPLHFACCNLKAKAVKRLIKAYANVDAQINEAKFTPLHIVLNQKPIVQKEQIDIVNCLIKASARLNIPDSEGNTPLHYASKLKTTEIAKLLIENGADINLQAKDNSAPLYIASYYKHQKIINLLDKGYKKEPKIPSKSRFVEKFEESEKELYYDLFKRACYANNYKFPICNDNLPQDNEYQSGVSSMSKEEIAPEIYKENKEEKKDMQDLERIHQSEDRFLHKKYKKRSKFPLVKKFKKSEEDFNYACFEEECGIIKNKPRIFNDSLPENNQYQPEVEPIRKSERPIRDMPYSLR